MASAADLSGTQIKFAYGAGPTEVEIISGSISDVCDVTHYLPVNATIKRSVAHGRLVTWNLMGAVLTTALPFSALAPGTSLVTIITQLDRNAGTPKVHTSTDVVVGEMVHEFDTSTHQVWRMVLFADGNYVVPS